MNKIIFQTVLFGLFISVFSCNNHKNIDAYLSELHQNGELNGNVLVIKEGKTLYEKSFGFTDGSKTMKLNKDYRFIIGSVYKEFPATAIMQLQESGRLNLSDKVAKHVIGLPKWSEQVSIKQLLQYSSGLPLIPWEDYFNTGITITDENLVNGLQDIENLEFEAGSDYLYSNNNPILLIKIVESITDVSFVNYVQENIFNPFNLNSTVFKKQYPYQDKTLMAMPFNTDFEEDDYNIAVRSLLMTSTARDMANWFKQLGDFEVVSKLSVKTLSEEAKIGDNIQAPLGRCDWGNEKIIEHSHHGSSGNYECVVRRFKQDSITIVILTNQKHRNVYDISNTIYELINTKK